MFTLIPNWKDAWRMWSIRLSIMGTAVLIFFEGFPDVAIHIWTSIPDDLKSVLPVEFARYTGYGLIAASWLSRIIRQYRLVERMAGMGGPHEHEPGILPESDSHIESAGCEPGSPDGLHGVRDRAEIPLPPKRP